MGDLCPELQMLVDPWPLKFHRLQVNQDGGEFLPVLEINARQE
jgi:hypothetical protein